MWTPCTYDNSVNILQVNLCDASCTVCLLYCMNTVCEARATLLTWLVEAGLSAVFAFCCTSLHQRKIARTRTCKVSVICAHFVSDMPSGTLFHSVLWPRGWQANEQTIIDTKPTPPGRLHQECTGYNIRRGIHRARIALVATKNTPVNEVVITIVLLLPHPDAHIIRTPWSTWKYPCQCWSQPTC